MVKSYEATARAVPIGPEAPPRALTVKKAVTYTGLSRSQIYRALKDKRLFRLKAGRRTLLLTEELDAYLLSLREQKLE